MVFVVQMKSSVEQQTIRQVLQPVEQALTDADSSIKADSAESSRADSGKTETSKAESVGGLVSSAVVARADQIVQQCRNKSTNTQDLQKR